MIRSLRLLSLGITLGALLTTSHAQTREAASLPLPENFFPDLKAMLETAVKQSPRMISRNAENAIAEQSRIAARAGQLPYVGGYYSHYPWERDDRADLPAPTTTKKSAYGVSLNQPLYHWGALESNTRIGVLSKKVTEGQTAEAYRLLVQEIRNLYLSVIIRKMAYARSQLYLAIAQDQFAIAQTKVEKKVLGGAELFTPQLTRDQALLATDRAAEDYENAKLTLSKLSGTPALADAQVPSEIPSFTLAPDTLAALFASYRSHKEPKSYYLESLRDQLEIEKLNYQIAKTRLKPKLNMIIGVSQDEQSYSAYVTQRIKTQSTYAGVSLNWSIFDGYSARSAVATSLLRRQQMEQAYEDALRNLSDSTRSALKQLDFSARSMDFANRLLGASQGGINAREEDLRRGLISEAELNGSRLSHLDSQIGAYNARSDYLSKTGDFLSQMLEDPALANLPGHNP